MGVLCCSGVAHCFAVSLGSAAVPAAGAGVSPARTFGVRWNRTYRTDRTYRTRMTRRPMSPMSPIGPIRPISPIGQQPMKFVAAGRRNQHARGMGPRHPLHFLAATSFTDLSCDIVYTWRDETGFEAEIGFWHVGFRNFAARMLPEPSHWCKVPMRRASRYTFQAPSSAGWRPMR